ncbi:hypothetical protein CLAFUW4_20033 [Fulvia fulva]|uniref:uncharacterized protein n=1 Tax=Passalora fulva TaxID=5499 RepID=UPI0028528E59|nr:uncharacterized protein CLAFUR5_20033 [Fulvia fulva]KAK4626387.1 hypothetical protein CLAFUR4_20033 [Fulvia fulva]KAK4628534.1 hypothetical protein CLAFUR0_20033 [Fulvia fulva]WMI38861.1 hypothetical protein CLAFUR5_20033 [Fulvia fulva]WPV13998.1 hypothetical protein CLAFUW4_20033 [Fulvia fulva]WPV28530.1 hypothetical protein CLAFUW7_20033 [Fulvia fulva]
MSATILTKSSMLIFVVYTCIRGTHELDRWSAGSANFIPSEIPWEQSSECSGVWIAWDVYMGGFRGV